MTRPRGITTGSKRRGLHQSSIREHGNEGGEHHDPSCLCASCNTLLLFPSENPSARHGNKTKFCHSLALRTPNGAPGPCIEHSCTREHQVGVSRASSRLHTRVDRQSRQSPWQMTTEGRHARRAKKKRHHTSSPSTYNIVLYEHTCP